MKLPGGAPYITLPEVTSAAAESFHSFSKGLCPTCRELVDGVRLIRDGRVYLRKQCPTHGRSEALISGDADWFLKSLTYVKEGSRPHAFSTEVKEGCPKDCGLCPDHEQHSCLPIIEVTNHCDLECPICIVQNRHNYVMTQAEMASILNGIVAREGCVETINISGGEPFTHPEILALLKMATARPEIARVSVSSNGLACARSEDLCRQLADLGVYVSLQLDALRSPELRVLRGAGDHAAVKRRALDNLEKAGVRTTIVSTLARGVNDGQIGEVISLLLERDFLLSLTFQPASYTGYGGSHFGPHDPMDVVTIPDVVRAAEEQTGGVLRRSDFLPLPCSHPGCFALTYLLKTEDAFVPFPRFLDLERYLEFIANRGTLSPDEGFEGAIRGCIDNLWTSSGQVPDAERILKTLKRAIHLMYPPDQAVDLERRLRIGEGLVKTIFIHAFMDVHTFEVERIKKCCTHYALPDGRLMPGCAYNLLYRDKDPRFTGSVGSGVIWRGAES